MKYKEPVSKILPADKAQISATNFKPLEGGTRFTSSCFKIFATKFKPFTSVLFLKQVLSSILASLVITMGIGVVVASAQSYVPLAPLPIGEGGTTPESYTFTTYLSGMIKLLIALGGAMAILFAIIGGTQYVAASTNPSLKEGAKERITGALIGLAIILSSYLLLNSINPKLVEFNLLLEPVVPKALKTYSYAIPISTATFRDDSATREALMKESNIIINKSACTTVGQKNCTSVQNLNGRAFSGLRLLDAKTCSRKNGFGNSTNGCKLMVTGGTEYWEHKTHGDGTVETSTVVDIRMGDADGIVDNYIKKAPGKIAEVPCGLQNAPKYQPDGPSGGTYVDEPNSSGTGRHWHVCY